VIAIVLQAVVRVGRRALHNGALVALAVAAFLCLAVLGLPFPVVVLGAGLVGWLLGRRRPDLVSGVREDEDVDRGPAPLVPDSVLHDARPSARRTVVILGVGLVLWVAPVVAAYAAAGGERTVFVDQGLFFGGMALVTFGGAYAVLSYVAQAAVETYGWLSAPEMVRGLGLAETTPGPLIMVVQFVAFVGAHRDPGGLDPWVAAVVASLLVTWVTFVPSFLFVLLGAPYMERLRGNRSLSAALTGITAAVVGVIANLGLYFAVHTLFGGTVTVDRSVLALELPDLTEPRWVAIALAALAAVLLFRVRWSVLRTLGVCAVLGLAAGLAGLPVS
jgi:chromate transporter